MYKADRTSEIFEKQTDAGFFINNVMGTHLESFRTEWY